MYGKYTIPPTLSLLLKTSKEWKQRGIDPLYVIGFYPTTEDHRYFNTPVDVIPFGSTGMDGIHYGFLTEFGSVTDLENAPIVCVVPMDFEQPAKIIARNFAEFLRINEKDAGLFYNEFQDKADYVETLAQWEEKNKEFDKLYPPDVQKEQAIQAARQDFFRQLKLPNIPDPFAHIKQIRVERAQQVVIKTQDQLGVVPNSQAPSSVAASKPQSTDFFVIKQNEELDIEKLRDFFQKAEHEQKLAIFRDMTQLSGYESDVKLRELFIEELIRSGLTDEANRITFTDW